MKTDLFQIALSHDIYHTLYLCSLLSSESQNDTSLHPHPKKHAARAGDPRSASVTEGELPEVLPSPVLSKDAR